MVRENSSHVSNEDDVTEIRVELNLALDLSPYGDGSAPGSKRSPSVTIRSVSQYAVPIRVGDPERHNKRSRVTSLPEMEPSVDGTSDEECTLEPLLYRGTNSAENSDHDIRRSYSLS